MRKYICITMKITRASALLKMEITAVILMAAKTCLLYTSLETCIFPSPSDLFLFPHYCPAKCSFIQWLLSPETAIVRKRGPCLLYTSILPILQPSSDNVFQLLTVGLHNSGSSLNPFLQQLSAGIQNHFFPHRGRAAYQLSLIHI